MFVTLVSWHLVPTFIQSNWSMFVLLFLMFFETLLPKQLSKAEALKSHMDKAGGLCMKCANQLDNVPSTMEASEIYVPHMHMV